MTKPNQVLVFGGGGEKIEKPAKHRRACTNYHLEVGSASSAISRSSASRKRKIRPRFGDRAHLVGWSDPRSKFIGRSCDPIDGA